MVIKLSQYREGVAEEHRKALLPESLASLGGLSPEVDLDLVVKRKGDRLFIKAHFRGSLSRECGRCLELYDESVQGEVDLIVCHSEDELAQDEIDLDVYTFTRTNDSVDCAQTIYEAMMLQVPIKAVCSEDCKGLSVVEESLPVEEDKDESAVDPRWAALKNMKS